MYAEDNYAAWILFERFLSLFFEVFFSFTTIFKGWMIVLLLVADFFHIYLKKSPAIYKMQVWSTEYTPWVFSTNGKSLRQVAQAVSFMRCCM